MINQFNHTPTTAVQGWFSEEFVYTTMVKYLKENGYKIHMTPVVKDNGKCEKIINAIKLFKREIIEIKSLPEFIANGTPVQSAEHKYTKGWFTEGIFNSLSSFTTFDNASIAMALPNAGRFQAIVEKLHDYFTYNDLYFRIYLINEDGSISVSNLNEKYSS